jgi:monoterpene epsilon-lactone hydrolase
LSARYDTVVQPLSDSIIKTVGGQVRKDELGGVTVYRVRAANYRANTPPLIYVHGGGWVTVSAKASVGDAALYAASTGREVISVEYTLAPRVRWQTITDQVIEVWKALIAQGFDPKRMGLCGVSAGGNIILGSTLKMRDQGLPLPGAIVAMSPSTDVAFEGDTTFTLGDRDPLLDLETIRWFAKAYLGGTDPRNPYVSPVHGDYRKAFPPTLLQVGTRELLLSAAVRQYQAMRSSGRDAVLDVYEGMPHGWPLMIWSAPEGRAIYKRAGEFLMDRLGDTPKG